MASQDRPTSLIKKLAPQPWEHFQMISSAAPSAAVKPIWMLALIWNVPVAILAYSFGFMTSYFLNDQVDTSDHVEFIVYGLVALLLSTAAMTLTLHKSGATPLGRAASTSLLAGTVLHLTFITVVLTLVS